MRDYIIVVSYARYQIYSGQFDIYINNQFFASPIKFAKTLIDYLYPQPSILCIRVLISLTIGRDVRGVASLAWGGVRGTGGDWSVIDHATQPLPTPPLSPPRTCPSSMLMYTV